MTADAQEVDQRELVQRSLAEFCDAVEIPVSTLHWGDSPRLNGENSEHIRILAAADKPLPPILVHRQTMRIIDGMHRLRAASIRGQETILVKFFDGTDEEIFVKAVEANNSHGLPLTLADREAAASRIIGMNPYRSNRWIASVTGLAPGTVAMIRRRVEPQDQGSMVRIGRDGRVRPISSADGRRVAWDILQKRPDASLREVARLAGISRGTVHNVRERLRRGDDPVPARESTSHQNGQKKDWAAASRQETKDSTALLLDLRKDPSLRFRESGRRLLRWLDTRTGGLRELLDMVGQTPPHCQYHIAKLARQCAEEWMQLAAQLESQSGNGDATGSQTPGSYSSAEPTGVHKVVARQPR